MSDEFSLRLRHPSTWSVCGPSFSGKTSLVIKLIKDRNKIFDKEIPHCIYCFKEWQPILQELKEYDKSIIFTKDIEEADRLIKPNTLLILDDLLLQISGEYNKLVSQWFVVGSHHRLITIVSIAQSLFFKNIRLQAINTLYLCLLKSPKDISIVYNLARQFCPGNGRYLIDAYKKATEKPGGYLFF